MSPAKSIGLMQKFANVSEEESPVGSLVDANRDRIRGKYFVPILYREPAFEGFDDFSDFVGSISCETSETIKFTHVVRIHAGLDRDRLSVDQEIRLMVRLRPYCQCGDSRTLMRIHPPNCPPTFREDSVPRYFA